FVAAGRKKLAAIRGKYGRVDPAAVTVELGQAATGSHVPQIEAMLSASGNRAAAVRRKGDGIYRRPPRLGEPLAAGTQFPAAVNVPEPQTVILAAGNEPRRVLRKSDAQNGVFMPFEAAHLLRAPRVPKPHGAVVHPGQQVAAVTGKGQGADVVYRIGPGEKFDPYFGIPD